MPSDTLPISSALAEAEPLSMQDLFSRDPESLSTRNIDEIIRYERELRTRLESTGGVAAARARPKKEKIPVDMSGLLDDDAA